MIIERKQFMLSTNDNPFNPFEDFDSWLSFDNEMGYNCSGVLMRIAVVKDDFTDKEYNEAIERAIDRIIELDFTNTYKKVESVIRIPVENDEKINE